MSRKTTLLTSAMPTTLLPSTVEPTELVEALTASGFTNFNCPSLGSQLAYGVLNFTGFFLNLFLFVAIYKKTTAVLRPYTQVLLTSAAIDIFSSFFQFLTQARPAFLGKHYLLTFALDGVLPKLVQNWSMFEGGKLNYLLIPEYVGCYFSVCYCCVPFIYRYLVICWDHQMRRLEFAFLVFIFFLLSLFCSVSINYASAGVYANNMKLVDIPNPDCTRFLPQFSESNNRAEIELSKVFQLWYYGTQVILATYLIIIACFVNIQFFLYQKRNVVSSQLKVQKQLTWTLGIQALVPLLAFYGPQTVVMILGWFDISFLYAYEFLFMAYALVPVLNALTVFVLISTYRSAFFSLATQAGHQILTSMRLTRYATSSTSSTTPLFVNPATTATGKRDFEMMSKAF
ncbi:hypothetical protein M3Y99_00650300 [Aphelenchoides fujianensis]|nr:hypothetical protein M3Y99_00650300 [Aphelenchoides fujianensis]